MVCRMMDYMARQKHTIGAIVLALLTTAAIAQPHPLDSLKNELIISTASNRINVLLAISQYFINVNLDSANGYAEKAMQFATDTKADQDMARIYSQLGRVKFITPSYDDALDLFLKAEHLLKQQEPVNKNELLRVYSNLGAIYERQDELDKSLHYYERSLSLLDEDDRDKHATAPSALHAPIYNNLGNTLIKMKDTLKAVVYYKKGLQYALYIKDYLHAGNLLNNLGKVMIEKKRMAEGYPYLKRGEHLREMIHDDRGLASSYRNLVIYFIAVNDLDSAKHYIHKTTSALRKIGDLTDKFGEIYMLLSDIYTREGKYDSALYAFKLHVQYKDSVFNGPKFRELARVEARYEMLHKSQEEQVKQKSREFKTIIAISILISGIIILLLLYAIQKVRSKNQRLQYEQLKLREEKLVSDQNNLQLELEYKQKDLTAQMLFLLKKDEFIHKVIHRLDTVKKDLPSEVQSKLLRITKELAAISKHNDTSWQEFELRFKEVHKDFYEKLEARYPELTPKERRLCALLKLNMTTKEISSITHQSTRSLEVARTRLRKKFNLTNSEVGLVDFLSKIDQ
jgi:Tfp pilus assembly protein PilF/DNA-binding CsgD family transcriptional regulator